MDWFFYFVAFPFAVLFISSAVYALYWCSKNGQLKEFEQGARSIFDEEEPVGRTTDRFPAKKKQPVKSAPVARL